MDGGQRRSVRGYAATRQHLLPRHYHELEEEEIGEGNVVGVEPTKSGSFSQSEQELAIALDMCLYLLEPIGSCAKSLRQFVHSRRSFVAGGVLYQDFYPDASTSQGPPKSRPMLGLTVYGSPGPFIEPDIQQWGWTNDKTIFKIWLSIITFHCGEYSEAAVGKGLAAALQKIAAAEENNEAQVFGQNHCIFVAASKSLPSLNSVRRDEVFLQKLDSFLYDATSVAKKFMQSFVSLSVISPKKCPRLKEIYQAGNVVKQEAECSTDEPDDTDYLVLISENFIEARVALSRCSSAIESAFGSHDRTGIDIGSYLNFPEDNNPESVASFGCHGLIIEPAAGIYKGKAVDFGVHHGLINEPAAGIYKGKAVDFVVHHILPNKDKFPVNHGQVTGDNFTEARPIRQPKTGLEDALAAIEHQLMDHCGDDDDIGGLQVKEGESSTNQLDLIADKVNDMMTTLKEAIHESVVSSLDKQERDDCAHGGVAPRDQSWISSQEVPVSLDPYAATVTDERQVSFTLKSQTHKGFDEPILKVTLISSVLPQTSCVSSSKVIKTIPTSNSIQCDLIKSPEHETTGNESPSLVDINPILGPITPQSAQFSTDYPKVNGFAQYICSSVPASGFLGSEGLSNSNTLKNWECLLDHVGPSSTSELMSSMTTKCFLPKQLVQNEHQVKRRIINESGHSSSSRRTACGNGVGNPEQNTKAGIVALTSSFGNITPPLQAIVAMLEGTPAGYVKSWEGDITASENGDTMVINRLLVYRKISASEMLCANWPDTVHMEKLIPKSQVDEMGFDGGNGEYLYVDALNSKSILDEIVANMLCACIRLPQQILMLYPSPERLRFVGMLYS